MPIKRTITLIGGVVVCLVLAADMAPQDWFLHKLVFDDPDNFVIMLLTIILGGAAVYQGWLLDRQDEKLVASLKLASDANKESKESSQRQLRAYLSLESKNDALLNGIGIIHLDAENNPRPPKDTSVARIQINGNDFLINRGQTPAYDVKYCVKAVWIQIDNNELQGEEFVKFATDRGDKNFKIIGTIASNARSILDYSTVSNDIDQGINKINDYYLLFMVKISYHDAFSKHRYEVISKTIRLLGTENHLIEVLVGGQFSAYNVSSR